MIVACDTFPRSVTEPIWSCPSWPQNKILLVVTFTIQPASSTASMLLYSLSRMFPHTFIHLFLSATQNPPLISTTRNSIMYFLVPSSS